MSVYQLKSKFQDLLRPISDHLAKAGATANQVTLGAVAISGVTAHLIAHHTQKHPTLWHTLPAALFVRMAMNAIDGMMAKEHGQASKLGAWLNEGGDMVSDTLLFASLYPHLPPTQHPALTRIILLSLLSELIAIANTLSTGERANHGPMGKSDRALVLGVIGLLAGFGVPIKRQQRLILTTVQLLLLITLINRLRPLCATRTLS